MKKRMYLMLGITAITLVMSIFVLAVYPSAQAQGGSPTATATETAQQFTLLDLNSASAEQFLTIPGMNNRMVREFLEYRPYISIMQFRREIGKYVDASIVAGYEKYVYVPVNIDESDAATLQQIPGIDAALADSLIAGRPYSTYAAFLEKLAASLSAEQVDYAKHYLEGYVEETAVATAEAPVAATAEPVAFTLLNLNTSTAEQFLTIPGMNNRMVREFMEYRPYISIAQFRREIGKYVDASVVAGYEKYIYVPVKINESDAATLQQIPGVDSALAESLIAARPYATNAAFLEKLAVSLSAEQVKFAENYLEAQ